MGRDLEEALQQQVAQPANSCVSESGVSFIDQVIRPLYEVICAVCPIIEFLFLVIMERTINITRSKNLWYLFQIILYLFKIEYFNRSYRHSFILCS